MCYVSDFSKVSQPAFDGTLCFCSLYYTTFSFKKEFLVLFVGSFSV